MRKISIATFLIGGMLILGGCVSPVATPPPTQSPAAPAATTPAPTTPAATTPAPVAATAPAVAAQTPTAGGALFTYSDLKITPDRVKPGGELKVTATVKNVGGQAGTDTVVVDFKPDGDDACPVIALMSKKVTLDAGAVETVTFDVTTDKGGGGAYIVIIDRLRGKLVVE